MRRFILASVITCLAMTAPFGIAAAQNQQGQNQQNASVSLPQLSAEWWQWALSVPTSANPLNDTTGEKCMIGQRGSIWFLAGTFGGTAERTCSLPEGVSLFFPVINSVNLNSPNVCGQAGPLKVADLRALVKPLIDAADKIQVTVDGKDLRENLLRRIQSNPFAAALPVDNLFVVPCNGDSPAGIYSPAVDDGYYVALGPLPVLPNGQLHTIHLHAESGTTVQDVIYHLNVVPVSLK